MRSYVSPIVLAVFVLLSTGGLPAPGQNKPTPADKVCKNAAGVAADGYDVVSYFTDRKPLRGSPLISLKRDGAEYRFVSVAHREQFAANPDAFLPQYGGHCTWGLSKGKPITGDPQEWLIQRGKLYFASSREALSQIQADVVSVIQQADEIWKQLY